MKSLRRLWCSWSGIIFSRRGLVPLRRRHYAAVLIGGADTIVAFFQNVGGSI